MSLCYIIVSVLFINVNGVQSTPQMRFAEKEFDFGEINQRKKISHVFKFKNIGDDTLVIEKVQTSCGCAAALVSAKMIVPGGVGEVEVIFDSRRYEGEVVKVIYVYSNDPNNSTVKLKIKGIVRVNHWEKTSSSYSHPSSFPIRASIKPKIQFFLFHSKDCRDCSAVIKGISPFFAQYNIHIKYFDLDELKDYDLLLKLEEKYNDIDNEIPVVVIGEHILGGKKEIQENFGKILQKYKQNGCEFPRVEDEFDTTDSLSIKKVYLAYFYSKGCSECERATYELKYLKNKYPNLVVKKFDIEILDNKKLNEALCELYGIPQKKRLVAPMIFVGDEFLVKREINRQKLINLIEKYRASGTKIPWQEVREFKENSEKNIKERFNKMSIFTVLFAGIVDGVNPCAFATILFFIAFLSFTGKKGKEILIVGISFTFSVLIVYFLIGIGIFSFVKNLTFIPIIRKVMFSIVGILAIILGGISIYDYFKFKKGKYEEVKLQLPKFLKRRIHADIRRKMQMRNYILASLVIGGLVSLSEFVCTGQVYFPTITFITTQVPSLKLRGLTYLFLYNLAFIVPLVIVFGAAYKGTTPTVLNLFWRKHGASTKLAISILFFLLGGLLIFYAYH